MAFRRVVRVLRNGGTAILPTDTVYGIFCMANRPKAIKKIYGAKRRPFSKKLPLVVGSMKQLLSTLRVKPALAKRLSRLPVTLKGLPRRRLNKAFVSPDGTIAVRLVDHPFTARVARAAGLLAGTSANLSGARSQTSAKGLNVPADIFFDDGATKFGKSTTIVDVNTLEIVRRCAAVRKVEAELKLIKQGRSGKPWKDLRR